MKDSLIQKQITLVGFKAVDLQFSVNSSKNSSEESKFELEIDDVLVKDDPNCFAKVFHVDLSLLTPEFKEVVKLKVEYHTVFQCTQLIDQAFLDSDFAKISAPAIGFPYLRAFVSSLTTQAGIPPIVLPSINFVQYNQEVQKQKSQD